MNNGWKKVEKIHGGGPRYLKYKSQLVVIIPPGKQVRYLCLTAEGYKRLGKPSRIDIYERGNNIALMGSDTGFAVVQPTESDDSLYYLSPTKWIRERQQRADTFLRPGVYHAVFDNDMIIFDSAQTPASL